MIKVSRIAHVGLVVKPLLTVFYLGMKRAVVNGSILPFFFPSSFQGTSSAP